MLKFTPGALATSGATVAFYANTDLTGPILTLTRGQEQPPLATKSVQDGNGAEIVTQVMDDAADKLVDKVVPPVYLDGASPTTIYMAELDYSGSRPILSTKQTLTGVDPVGTAPSSETSVASTVVAKTAAYSAADGDVVLANASGGAFTVTLPAPASGVKVTVKNVGATGIVTVGPHAAETIDGADHYVLPTQYLSRDFLSNGTDWWVV